MHYALAPAGVTRRSNCPLLFLPPISFFYRFARFSLVPLEWFPLVGVHSRSNLFAAATVRF